MNKNKNKKKTISAGIVLFNPNIERLNENIQAIVGQVDRVILFDNGSSNYVQIKSFLHNNYPKCFLITSKRNKGIAYALNKIANVALTNGYKWLLTLDQDSVASDNLISTYEKYMYLPNVGQLTCNNKDRNLSKIHGTNNKIEEVKYCITSGTILNLDAWKKVNGFDSSMFIDRVDNEFCCALRAKGYKTYKLGFCGILHEMGNITKHYFFNKTVVVMNYNAMRYYYIAKNSILLARRYPHEENIIATLVHEIKIEIKILLYEKEKGKKILSILRGMRDGFYRKKTRSL